MSWEPVDCHAHTVMSDGLVTVEQLVERAQHLGVRPSVSDHVSRAVPGAIASVDQAREYLDVLDQHPVLRGAEFCWHDHLWRELPDELTRRFTHRIGSLHAIFLPDGAVLSVWTRRVPSGLTVGAYMQAHLDNVELFAREMPVDILAHPTLVHAALRDADPAELWTEAREERLVGALYGAGIALEVSARYPPHERLVRRAAERGVRLALGSDGHAIDEVADIARPLALTRALGVPDGQLYDPGRHGREPTAARGLAERGS